MCDPLLYTMNKPGLTLIPLVKDWLILCCSLRLASCIFAVTHIRVVYFLWETGKQSRPRSDATERDVLTGSSLLAYKIYFNISSEFNAYQM